jgi:hypothetical protein
MTFDSETLCQNSVQSVFNLSHNWMYIWRISSSIRYRKLNHHTMADPLRLLSVSKSDRLTDLVRNIINSLCVEPIPISVRIVTDITITKYTSLPED